MSEFSNNPPASDFDRGIDDAWVLYRTGLADRIAAAAVGDQLVVETVGDSDGTDGRVPFVLCHVLADADGPLVRCEIPSAPSLPPRRRLSDADRADLLARGWSLPESSAAAESDDDLAVLDVPSLVVAKAPRWADQLADMTVALFRDTWNVPHPSFLSLHHLGADGDVDPASLGPSTPEPAPLDRHVAIRPRDTDHLREVIARTLLDMHGKPPELDSDGDFVLRFGSALALVIVNESAPELQLWAPLLRDISGRTRASELITDLNRRWPYLRFALFEDRLRVMIDLLADPFVPQHFVDMTEHLGEFLTGADEEFASHFGGVLHFPPRPTVGESSDGPSSTAPASETPAADRDILPDNRSDSTGPAQEPIQPSLFDDLDDQ